MLTVTYGAETFEDRLMHARIKFRLNSLRGMVARTVIGDYVTTFIDAAAVLADMPPIELLIMKRIEASKYKRGQDVRRDDVYDENEHFYLPTQPRLGRKTLNQILRNRILNTW